MESTQVSLCHAIKVIADFYNMSQVKRIRAAMMCPTRCAVYGTHVRPVCMHVSYVCFSFVCFAAAWTLTPKALLQHRILRYYDYYKNSSYFYIMLPALDAHVQSSLAAFLSYKCYFNVAIAAVSKL